MICHGDELGRTRHDDNDGSCQDNELSWIDWSRVDEDLICFTATVARPRTDHPVLRRRRFFEGRPAAATTGCPTLGLFQAPTGPLQAVTPTLAEVRAAVTPHCPARTRQRGLFWRYLLTWRRQ
jgi:pullulanase/glycogen debranching enzyme